MPLIVYDPRLEADVTRGTACDALVEVIDLVPTFLVATGALDTSHRLEGRSLQLILHGQAPQDWRDAVLSEVDYAFHPARAALDVDVLDVRSDMLRTERWNYVYFKGFPPQLFDLHTDPDELEYLGT